MDFQGFMLIAAS